ncbi:Pullulanase 1, chloroplastic [Tetrabaena socialis]|uniref:Pullulanase 1, chloroplastic n=1 Tax=Tetrabaena socialis TaxID=47790 RepID=A0A2J8AD97_9CHLO|nr:Pullulanase 1, chloroplastic [Tetrabaena socialis]|eukprot:PNH10492.1 Pullulanase 1, chloroplastic [Tetrabaena socialis]
MSRGRSGSWSLPRPAAWLWGYYTYRVTTYCPWTARFEGLVTGLALAPNPEAVGAGQPASLEAQRAELLVLSDWVRSALAGNLRKYPLHLCDGSTRTGEQAQAHGLPLAYGGLPCEHVPFIGCHDNKTVFDQVVEKAAATETAEERMRMCVLCLALVALSQGVPFVHAGDDLLRSKSLDRDSYNSGAAVGRRLGWAVAVVTSSRAAVGMAVGRAGAMVGDS